MGKRAECGNKQKHKSQRAAKIHARGLAERYGAQNLNVYCCVYCGFWHVGRNKQNAHKNKYLTRVTN